MARRLKEKLGKPIIFGGVHPTLFPEDIDFSYVDYLCIGEGEYPVLELMNALERDSDPSTIKNLWAKKGDAVIKNEMRDLIQDLDSLPMPTGRFIINTILFIICLSNDLLLALDAPTSVPFVVVKLAYQNV